jgi:hypothetical protein
LEKPMTQRRPFGALAFNTLTLTWMLAGCGDYSHDNPGSGGTGASGGSASGQSGSGGSAQAGTGGSGQSGSGGSGQAGTGGSQAGTAGSAQSGTGGEASGGTAGTAAGSSGAGGTDAGTAGTGGSAGGGPVTCDEAAACGGDLTGTWTVKDCPIALTGHVDLTELGLLATCVEAPITMGMLDISGTLTLNADGTYADGTVMTGQTVFEFPKECLILSGTETDCAGIASPLTSKGFSEVVCVTNPETEGCTCTGTLLEQEGGLGFKSYDAATEGDYEVTGQQVALSSYSDDAVYAFCATGNKLTMKLETVADSGALMNAIVLEK